MMYSTWYDQVEYIVHFLNSLGLTIPVCHCEKGIGEMISRSGEGETDRAIAQFEINCRIAREIGAETLVLHLWNGEPSDRNIDHNIEVCGQLREIALRYGHRLTVENVVCNRQDPMTHLLCLAERYPEMEFTFDTKMAQFHGQMNALYAAEGKAVAGRVRHMHINDYAGGYKEWSCLKTLHIGEGNVDFDSQLAFLRRTGYAGDFTVEATSFRSDGTINFDALNRDFDRIRAYIGRE